MTAPDVSPRVRSAVVARPIDLAALLAEVGDVRAGATSLFVGTVRDTNDGRAVTGIDYQCYQAMAERELAAICAEVAGSFGPVAAVVEHRVGFLALGEASVAIAVSHRRRAGAADGARHAIEEIKRRVPIWKREHYADGTREWVDPTGAANATRDVAPGSPVDGVPMVGR